MVFRTGVGVHIALWAVLLSSSPGRALQTSGAQTTQPPDAKTSQPSAGNTSQAKSEQGSSPDLQEKAWGVLQTGLRSKRAAQRTEAVKALSLLEGNRQAIRFSLRAMRDKDPRVRASAASTLGDLHATNAIPALRAAVSDKDASVMLAATHALYILKDALAYEIYYAILMGDKKTNAGLIQSQMDRLKDPKQVAQMGIQEGIGFVPYAGMGYEAYRQLMKHDNAPVRAAAARFLALDPDPVSADALVQVAVTDKNIFVRQAALDAITQRADPRCIGRLAINLDDKKYPVRYRTAAAIIKLGSKQQRKPSPE